MYSLLYVDDEPGLLDIGKLFLEESGEFSVVTIDSASAALNLLNREKFDAIISDYQMPEMDGIGLLKQVRSNYGDIPFILFTGRGREDVVIEAINCGADFYVQKGGDIRAQFADLAHLIKKAIGRRRAEHALRKSEERLALALEGAELGTWDFTIKTGETICNERWARMLGYVPDEPKSAIRSWETLVHPDDLPGVKREFRHHIDGKTPQYRSEYRVRTRSGGWIWILDKGKVIDRDDQGRALRAAGTHLDITERRETEEALRERGELHRKLIASIPDIVVQTALDGTIVAINDTVVAVGGYAGPGDLIGKKVFTFFAPGDLPRVAENTRLMFERKLGPVEYHFFKNDGTLILLEVNGDVLRMPDGRPYGMVFVCRDITDRKQAEVALQLANRKLRLLSGVTMHDINNQMMVVMGHLGILQENQSDAVRDEELRKITAAAERISAMIRFTREYEEIGVAAPAWQEIRTLIRRAAWEAPLGDLMLRIDLPDTAEVLADPLIVKAFYNLMENAARFGGEITTIRFSVLDRNGDQIVVCEGDGVRAEEKEKIFWRGFGENTGLGLFLAREILSITGIAIRETGEPGEGARFEITIPPGMYRIHGEAGHNLEEAVGSDPGR